MNIDSIHSLKIVNSFADLPDDFHTCIQPQPLTHPTLLHANYEVASQLGLSREALHKPDFLDVIAGNQPLHDGQTLAAVYSGHQFGIWAGQLGDGRAHLLGEVVTPNGNYEIQLKGSGLTPYSRMGDGRAVIRSTVREYLASEAMAGLNIPTTRALAIVTASNPVQRETLERAAVLARVAPSFVRFGNFEHWAEHPGHLDRLVRYVTEKFYPECTPVDSSSDSASQTRALCLLKSVVERSARLVAHWQTAGFCHGVMNTDNMSILGLTLDYGPYGFMDGFQIDHVCNHTDTLGRYAWNAQPAVMQWNLHRFAGSLMGLGIPIQALEKELARYESLFLEQYSKNLARKFGWQHWQKGDEQLVDSWWHLLHAQQADFTLAFRRLDSALDNPDPWLELFSEPTAASQWLEQYRQRTDVDGQPAARRIEQMQQANPLYVLRNHLAQKAIEDAENGSATEIETLLNLLRQPFHERAGYEYYARPAPVWAQDLAISCSS